MKLAKFSPPLFGKRHKWFWLLCLTVTLCLSCVALAQSGRRKDKPEPRSTVAPQTVEPLQVHSILVSGRSVDGETKEIWSNYRSAIAKACLKKLQEEPLPPWKVIDGGKMTRKEAYEFAKRQTDTFVLWFGYRVSVSGFDISYLDYVVIRPQTGNILFEGRVDPNQGRVKRSPVEGTVEFRSIGDQLEAGGRLVAERVRARI